MNVQSRRPLFLLVCGMVLLSIISALLIPSPVQADIGIQPILPGGNSIIPDGESPIHMAVEKVVMTVRQGTDADHAAIELKPGDLGDNIVFPMGIANPFFPTLYMAVADVSADFTMRNPTNEEVSMTVWFPLASTLEKARWEEHIGESAPHVENFKVTIDGNPQDLSVIELPNPQGEDKPPLPWASFPVTFPAGEDVNIQVNYVFLPQPSATELVGMTLSYIFQTGAGWAGPIGKVELQINLPYPASLVTIGVMPEGGQIKGQQVSWTWENLEPGPEDDFSILILRPERWEEIEYWRGIVSQYPDFAQGWLYLATLYERLSQGVMERGHIMPYFGTIFQKLGVQAAREAARLEPGAIEPHYELALLYAAALEQNPSVEELQPVLDELNVMKELNPIEAQALEPNVQDILYWVLYNDATAAAEATTWAAEPEYNDATATADAISGACWAAYGVFCDEATGTADAATRSAATATIEAKLMVEPSETPAPPSSVTTQEKVSGGKLEIIVGIVVIALALAIVSYVLMKQK